MVSAAVGSTVNYTVTGQVPDLAGYNADTYTYIITDEMTEGLTLDGDSIKVWIGDIVDPVTNCVINHEVVKEREGEIDETSKTVLTVSVPVGQYQSYVGQPIVIKYRATVNEKAANHSSVRNSAKLRYGMSAQALSETTAITEELYSSNITVNKYHGSNADDKSKKLANARFVLMNSNKEFYHFSNGVVNWEPISGIGIEDERTSVSDDAISALAEAATSTITAYETDSNGAATFAGLADGTYYLVEIAAPTGYNRLHHPEKVAVLGTNVDSDETENIAQAGNQFDSQANVTVDIQNSKGSELPETGGIGTFIFYVVGGILVVVAAVGLLVRFRTRNK